MLLLVIAICMAIASMLVTITVGLRPSPIASRRITVGQAASVASIGLLLLFVAHSLALGVMGPQLVTIRILEVVALLAVGAATLAIYFDREWQYAVAGLYAYALAALGIAQTVRGFSPRHFFVWGIASDLAAFVLIAALIGWLLRVVLSRSRFPQRLSLGRRWPIAWFLWSQAALTGVAATLTMWVSMDSCFDGMGEGAALFGLSGRSAGCTAALMLLGTSILMAWQTGGRWRAMWQCAAILAGLLLTSSIGWARIDTARSEATVWSQRCTRLLISAAMMTVMTRFGLARVLPRQSDWIPRARQLSPIFGGLAMIMLAIVLIQRI